MATHPTDPRESWPTPRSTAPTLLEPAPPPTAPPEVPPERNLGWGMLLALGVLALVAIGILIAWLVTRPDHRTGATTVVVTTSPSSAPTTRSTRPKVSVPIAVPDVLGQSQAPAERALRAAGLKVTAATVPSHEPRGIVTAQHPAATSRIARGSHVRINVSAGSSKAAATTAPTPTPTTTASAPPQPKTASVPDATGDPLQAAVQRLATSGFLISLQYVPSDDPLGTVVAQSPQSGASATTGSHVTVNAASGPGTKPQETVPDLTGGTLPHAVAAANGAQLRLIYVKRPVRDKSQAGTVVDQSPAAGAHAPRNAQVLAYLAAYEGGP